MSGSKKGRYFAAFLVGLVAAGIAFATLAYSFQLGNVTGYNEARSFGYAGEYPESTAKSIDICFGQPGLFNRQECIEQAIASGRESQRAEYDLNAQRDMAEWAFWLLVLTGLGLSVTIVGTIGLYWQIMLTRKAVEDTGLATDAMLAANEIAKAAQRPWLKIEILSIGPVERRRRDVFFIHHSLKISNTGHSPALFVSSNISQVKADAFGKIDIKQFIAAASEIGRATFLSIAPGSDQTINAGIRVEISEIDDAGLLKDASIPQFWIGSSYLDQSNDKIYATVDIVSLHGDRIVNGDMKAVFHTEFSVIKTLMT
tara:strand:+ start:23410 stop:24351 length:942 start_codon:yes stop_codon:yes gene_type:complete